MKPGQFQTRARVKTRPIQDQRAANAKLSSGRQSKQDFSGGRGGLGKDRRRGQDDVEAEQSRAGQGRAGQCGAGQDMTGQNRTEQDRTGVGAGVG